MVVVMDMYVAANHAKKQLFNIGTVLSFNDYYHDEYYLNSGRKKLDYPKTYEGILEYVNSMLFSRTRENNERIAQALFVLGIDIVVSYHGTGIYDVFNERYLDYVYVGSVYDHDTDIGKTLHEIREEEK
jgi:hypothetical protein